MATDPAPRLHPFWLEPRPLILASASAIRRALLVDAGLPVMIVPASIDERALETQLADSGGARIAAALAAAKAVEVSRRHPEHLVLGADQTLVIEGNILHKPSDRSAAVSQLTALQGRTHHLISAFAVARAGEVIQHASRMALITLRPLSRAAIERYLDAAGPEVFDSVGTYQLERLGVHLMAHVEGDHFTVLGLPMVEVLGSLRELGAVA